MRMSQRPKHAKQGQASKGLAKRVLIHMLKALEALLIGIIGSIIGSHLYEHVFQYIGS